MQADGGTKKMRHKMLCVDLVSLSLIRCLFSSLEADSAVDDDPPTLLEGSCFPPGLCYSLRPAFALTRTGGAQ